MPGLEPDHLGSQPDLPSHQESVTSSLTSLCRGLLCRDVGIMLIPNARKLVNTHNALNLASDHI